MNNKPSFWTNPNGFSILDLLAIIYTSIFLIMLVLYIKYPLVSIKEVIGYLSPLIYIIISGYFTGQAVQQFRSASASSSNYTQPSYGQSNTCGTPVLPYTPVTPITIPTNTGTTPVSTTPVTTNNDSNMSV